MYNQPIEEFTQYIDRNGVVYVSSKPKDLEPWFNDMIERYGLYQLVSMFPYVTLVLDTNTGMLKTWAPCNYNAKVTNAFHILLAKQTDERYKNDTQEEFALDLEKYFPKEDIPEYRYIEYNKDDIIESDKDRYGIDYDSMPDSICIKPPPPNSHPNKDNYGNYRTAKPTIQTYGYYNPYSYLPQYQTLQQYPALTR